jgi:hypothetical protein
LVAANSFNRTPQARAFSGVQYARACGVRLNDCFVIPSKQSWWTTRSIFLFKLWNKKMWDKKMGGSFPINSAGLGRR